MKKPCRAVFATLVFAALLSGAADLRSAVPPNIILILSDDVGAETIGAYGGESYQTPNIDQLARDGVRFEYAHAQPLCTPSRVKIMTGQYNFRNYHHFGYLDPNQATFAHVLKEAGYSTVVAGKWQLYDNRFQDIQGSMPSDAGFDEYLLWQLTNEQAGSRFWAPLLNHNGKLIQHGPTAYGPDIFNNYVLDYIGEQQSQPFFIYYPMVLAHDPWVTTPDMQDHSANDQDKFAAMMAYMDKLVGNIRSKIEQEGLADRTVILFIGDNGTARDIVSLQRGTTVRGGKGKTIDAGTRVPFIAWGPGSLLSGLESNALVNFNDVLPTLADLASIELPESYPGDGVSLLPILTGQQRTLQRDNIFIHYEPRWPTGKPARYAFDRRWKLYEGGGFYDVKTDPLEKNKLDIKGLAGEGAAAYSQLYSRLQLMPGDLTSNRRWFPAVFYKLLLAAGLGLVLVFLLIVLLWRHLRRRGSAIC
ncbi:MAG: sulfatase-like hydrolase/transferase [Halioglobus sp.]